jgi:serine/threonine protein kinase/WD40 repeat protein
MSENPSPEEVLFDEAIALPRDQRGVFLAKACGANTTLLARLTALFEVHEGPDTLLSPAVTVLDPLLGEEKAGAVIGRYKLLQKIGEGGCGVVWMAEQEEPVRRRVALKIIKLGMDTKAVIARFEGERQALAMMDHPNIAKVLDGGATDLGRPYFVMELVRGTPITSYCDEHQLAPTDRLELFVKVCHAIQHAHQKGVIHRDIKPSNILVTVNDGQPTPKVIDFGIAKATQGRLTDATVFTAFEHFIGTPVYMSPEQAEMSSLDIDTRSDIYSLGILLYELLTGKPPFDPKVFAQAGVDQIRQQIREREPPRPSARLRTLTQEEQTTIARLRATATSELSLILRGDLDWIVMRCIEKDRMRRYDTANGLAMDIQRYLRNEPVVARPPSTTYLMRKLIRRHRFGFVAVVALVTVVSIGAVVSTWQAIRARMAEKEQTRLRLVEVDLRRRAETQELAARQKAYAADMNVVRHSLAEGRLDRARELLYRQRPADGNTDLRGWEWRYLWQFCQSDAASVIGNVPSMEFSLSASHDGKWLAAGGHSIWNLQTREETRIKAQDPVTFSPVAPILAAVRRTTSPSGETKHVIVLWNASTQQELLEFPLAADCGRLAFSGDGKTLATIGNGPSAHIELWRVSDGAKLRRISAPSITAPRVHQAFGVAPDLSVAAHAVPDGVVRVVDLQTGAERWAQVATKENVVALAFSPDSRTLATSGGPQESTIRLWDVGSGKETGHLTGHRSYVNALVFLSDGKTLVTAGGDHSIRVWDVERRALLRTLRGHTREIYSLALLPDDRTVASWSLDGAVFLWDIARNRSRSGIAALPKRVKDWQFGADGRSVVTVDENGNVERWQGESFQHRTLLATIGETEHALLSENCSLVAALKPEGMIEVWDWERQHLNSQLRTGDLSAHALQFTPDGHRLFVGTYARETTVHEWGLSDGVKKRSWQTEVPRYVPGTGVTLAPDGKQLLLTGWQTQFALIDLVSGSRIPFPGYDVHQGGGTAAYSPDGELLAVPSRRGFIKIWNARTLDEVTTLRGFMQAARSAAFSPDNSRLAIAGGGFEAIKLWSATSFEEMLTLEAEGTARAGRTAFSPDGDVIGSSFWGMVHLWRVPSWSEIDAAEKKAGNRP